MPENIFTLADLIESGYRSKTSRDCLFLMVKTKLQAGEELFPDIFGVEAEKRRFIEILMSGKGALLTGEYGVAKTDLAKHIQLLLHEYHTREEIYYVEQCPVQEDPMILARFMSLSPQGTMPYKADPCPICRAQIRDVNGDQEKIAVRRLDAIVEGRGFARVQGGGDVLPEEIVGTYNLLKLAQIGDRIFLFQRQRHDRPTRHEFGQRTVKRPAGMDGVKLLRLMLRDFQHLHGQNVEAIFLELLDDVSDRVLLYRVGLDDGECALQCFHKSGLRCQVSAKPIRSPRSKLTAEC